MVSTGLGRWAWVLDMLLLVIFDICLLRWLVLQYRSKVCGLARSST
jgi:hypothetical protein